MNRDKNEIPVHLAMPDGVFTLLLGVFAPSTIHRQVNRDFKNA
jgi:hypothetical protein